MQLELREKEDRFESIGETLETLGARMRDYERTTSLEADKPWVVRLDGHNFSKLTQGLNKPFDSNLYKTMVGVCYDLMSKFSPSLIYTQSDEITLIFFPRTLERKTDAGTEICYIEPIHKGRIQKIASVFAAYASVRLNYWLDHYFCAEYTKDGMREADSKVYSEGVYEKVLNMEHYFDARVFQLPNADEVYNNLLWRQLDCIRESVYGCARTFYNDKELENSSTIQKISMIRKAHGEWADMHVSYRQGTFFKKARVEVEGNMRSRTMSFTLDFTLLDEVQKNNLLKSLQHQHLTPEDFKILDYSSKSS